MCACGLLQFCWLPYIYIGYPGDELYMLPMAEMCWACMLKVYAAVRQSAKTERVGWNQTGEGSNCLLNVEMEGVQELKPQENNQSVCVSVVSGHVSPPL